MSQAGDAARELLRALSTRIGPPDRPTEHGEDEDCGGLCGSKSCVDKAMLKLRSTGGGFSAERPFSDAAEPVAPSPRPPNMGTPPDAR